MASASTCANPLFLQWIGEWLEAARQHNSKGFTVLVRIRSVVEPDSSQVHPSEAMQLHGLGPRLCQRLEEKLRAHCLVEGIPLPDPPQRGRKRSGDSGGGDDEPAPAKKARKAKPYVPALRSGPYAIILALSSVGEDSSKTLTKNEIIALGQPHCDSSFTAPSDPSKYFTAWNSIKTLTEKDMVFEHGRPLRRYALTEEGWAVAKRIQRTLSEQGDDATTRGVPTSTTRATSVGRGSAEGGHWVGTGPSRLWVDADDEAPDVADVADVPDVPDAELGPSEDPRSARMARKRKSTRSDYDQLLSSSPVSRRASEPCRAQSTSTGPPTASGGDEDGHRPSFTPLVLPAGAFTVTLVLDNREVRAKQDRDYIQNELTNKGVQPLVRNLGVGDALWVAKCHDPDFLRRLGEEGDEVVLDWIVERKRLDDLIGSIKDGRFHEQKFRLRKSGVRHVIYIIEEMAMNAEHMAKCQEAVDSAIASMQVVNGYFVKQTQKLDDTIRYLTRMTVLLRGLHENKPLHIIPTPHLDPRTYHALRSSLAVSEPATPYHITYPSFASLASKSDDLTLRDVYLKMLMCTRGITADKALEMQKVWPTPRALVQAFEECGPGRDDPTIRAQREVLFTVMGEMVGRKKVGRALSAKVAEVWGRT
ncbi:MAG: Crossover junction endonuclease mus81 [Thelocarpon superellum]|nr:MAG: Crossover junction endonuclease mus81 [Thelocarpon superellum]